MELDRKGAGETGVPPGGPGLGGVDGPQAARGDISSPFDAFGASDCDTVPLYCATERKLVF